MGKKEEGLPGHSLGYPMYHAVTGNLPVISKELHRSSAPGSSAASDDALMPGWCELVDPITGSTFWWNTFYRSRRDTRPARNDDGRRGAGRGDHSAAAKAAARKAKLAAKLASKTWEEKYDLINSRTYYWNRRTNTTQWKRPDNFFEDGVSYKPVWQERVNDKGDVEFVNTRTGEATKDLPDTFDCVPSTLTWEARPDGLWHNWITGEKQRERPLALDSQLAKLPSDAPPAPPAEDIDLADFVDEDDLDLLAGDNVVGHHAELLDELEEKVYPPRRGWLKKRGGGYSGVFASTGWKERYFVSDGTGVLTYYEKETHVNSKKGPIKGWKLNLRYYGVNSMPDDPLRFTLVPTPDAFSAYTHAAGAGMPPPDRVFELEALNAGDKANWVTALRGKPLDIKEEEDLSDDEVDVTEESEAHKMHRKAQKHAREGRGVYRIASHAAIKKSNMADKLKATMFEEMAAAGLGSTPKPGSSTTPKGSSVPSLGAGSVPPPPPGGLPPPPPGGAPGAKAATPVGRGANLNRKRLVSIEE